MLETVETVSVLVLDLKVTSLKRGVNEMPSFAIIQKRVLTSARLNPKNDRMRGGLQLP
ncbi:MAG TPA: hypothetical protein VFX97_09875 [Pyrinomonadaceae bacterium]|nr:hypothetical protein [Pyrinomonadaceae bacterium]